MSGKVKHRELAITETAPPEGAGPPHAEVQGDATTGQAGVSSEIRLARMSASGLHQGPEGILL